MSERGTQTPRVSLSQQRDGLSGVGRIAKVAQTRNLGEALFLRWLAKRDQQPHRPLLVTLLPAAVTNRSRTTRSNRCSLQNRHRADSDDTSNPSIQFIPSVLSLEHQPLCANPKLLFAASSSLQCQHGIDRCLLPGVRLTKIIPVPSPVPDPTVALIAQDDVHLWRQTPRVWIISSPCSSGTRIAPNRCATNLCCRCCK